LSGIGPVSIHMLVQRSTTNLSIIQPILDTRGTVGKGIGPGRARHLGLSACPGQPNLTVGQADFHAYLPDGQLNILLFC
jgi:hypothetical protein